MSAVSTIILVGNSHPNRGGNRPFAQIQLEEGSRPALVLRWIAPPRDRPSGCLPAFTMIPTLEDMLDDSVLMVAYAVLRHPDVVKRVAHLAKETPLKTGRLEMYRNFLPSDRQSLYAMIKGLENFPKVTWCLFDGSPIESSLDHLAEYRLECEVSRSVFVREYSAWTNAWEVRGTTRTPAT